MKSLLLGSVQVLKKHFKSDKEALKALSVIEEKIGTDDEDLGEFTLPKEVGVREYALFSDGACRGNPGPGAWGVVGQDGIGEVIFELSSFDPYTTNNKMELLGAIKAIEMLQSLIGSDISTVTIHLYSDSKYVVDGLNSWVPGWKKRGWKKADKKVPENLDLWQSLDELKSECGNLVLHWVKGHAGHPQNERCDELANLALDHSGN